MSGTVTVLAATMAAVTDLGRAQGPALGLAAGGALDQSSARVANTLVGNRDAAPLIEITAFDFSFRTDTDILIAVTGARMDVYVDDIPTPMWAPVFVQAGQKVELENMSAGLRAYVAVHGSFEVPLLIGSCAPDAAAGFGSLLAADTTLALHASTAPLTQEAADVLALFDLGVDVPYFGPGTVIDVTDGPDIDEFAGTVLRLFAAPFRITDKSNHIGLRMTGRLPVREVTHEILSRGVPIGAVEIPPGDELVVLHRGRGVTAGYPVLAVVTPVSLDTLAQVRPGEHVRFRHATLRSAAADAHYWHHRLQNLRHSVDAAYTHVGRPDLRCAA
ncbi:MAG TPA: biotin-dependent carboxyltransferase family protein [Microbacterium sp.]|uniref:5-oxoprolinase subunit C family protein n=1 Tax=Microbacterium sp. TaxID=51671 RepID=UPI002B4670EA|nr:biotin-dependent carboxyltransferase family protein [Microbacterium sp.]HKT56254.1 biotin-dependent carboxyltransferase family protein [Microbacterium sp.]